MRNLAYFEINENMTPYEASDAFALAKKSGYDRIWVKHEAEFNMGSAKCKERLLSVFRAALRHKVGVYISDDSFIQSGTGFSQVCSVRDVWQKELVRKSKDDVCENEEIICEKDGECVVARIPEGDEFYPYGHYVDLTNPECAKMVIEAVYAPILREYTKFKGYELKGFVCDSPVYDSLGEKSVPCSKAALVRFEENYNRKPDVFAICEMRGDYDAYMSLARECMEEGYVLPLAEFCAQNSLELVVCGGDGSVSYDFCEKENLEYLTKAFEGRGRLADGANATACVCAFAERMDVCVKINQGMDKIRRMGEFFDKYADAEIIPVEAFSSSEKDCYILTNLTDKVKEFCFLPDCDWCVLDWEKDEVYNLQEKKTYKFYPYSFLCIKKKSNDMYSEDMPLRVGGVVCGETEESGSVSFEYDGYKYTFTLPDEKLFGKYVEFEGNFNYLEVKMGYNEHAFVTRPCIIPLYDFLCGTECIAKSVGGEIEDIKIIMR